MELLTVREAAAELRVAPITIRRHIAAGRLAAVRVGRSVRIDRAAIERFLAPEHDDPAEAATEGEGQPFTFDDPLWDIVGIGSSVEPTDKATPDAAGKAVADSELEGRPLTEQDSLWSIIGIGDSGPDGPTDVSSDKHRYLAEAYADLHEE